MSALYTTGRAVLGGFFVLAGINKVLNYTDTQAYMDAAGLDTSLLPIVILLELIGGAVVAVGRPCFLLPWAAVALAGFSVLTNLFFHRFWDVTPDLAQLELSLFFKNLGIAGALVMVAGSVMTRKTTDRTR